MDFSKLKEGVISLATFIVSHAMWLSISFYSVWIGFGDQLETNLQKFFNAAVSMFENEPVKMLLDAFSLKPLVPALAVFVAVFILHAHKKILEDVGRYIPPELVWYWMPGLRNISVWQWNDVLRQLGPDFNFEKLRAIVQARYDTAIKEYSYFDYSSSYNICKSIATMNIVIFIITFNKSGLSSFYLFAIFFIASFMFALLQTYHARNNSHWAIDNIFRDLLAQRALGEIKATEGEKKLTPKEFDEIKNYCDLESKQPIVSLSWSIPFIGNLRILKESLSRTKY